MCKLSEIGGNISPKKKNHVCNKCGKGCVSKYNLKKHIKDIHTDIEHKKGKSSNTTHKNCTKPVRASDKSKSRCGNQMLQCNKEHGFDDDSSDKSNHGNNFNDCNCNDNENDFDEIAIASKYQ